MRRLRYITYLVDVLALELRKELVKTIAIRFDSHGVEDGLDVFGRRAGVATESQKEVCCEVLHFELC
jgi:hypothetical protein